MAIAWQTHGTRVANAWQTHGERMANARQHMADAWQPHDNARKMLFDLATSDDTTKPRTPFRARSVAQAKATPSARSLGNARASPPLLPRRRGTRCPGKLSHSATPALGFRLRRGVEARSDPRGDLLPVLRQPR